MSHSVQMPALGESVTEGTVTRWLKSRRAIRSRSTSPCSRCPRTRWTPRFPSPYAGVLEKIVVGEDETAAVGAELAMIGDGSGADSGGDATAGEASAQPSGEEPQPEPEAVPASEAPPQAEPSTETEAPREKPTAGTGGSSGGGTSVTLPEMGESVTEGTVTRWLKAVGDEVALDEALVEISTDKVDTEVPSPVAGTLLEISVGEDETIAGRRPARRHRRRVGRACAAGARSGGGTGAAGEAGQRTAPPPRRPKLRHPLRRHRPPRRLPPPRRRRRPLGATAPSGAGSALPPAPVPEGTYVTPVIRKLAADSGVDLVDGARAPASAAGSVARTSSPPRTPPRPRPRRPHAAEAPCRTARHQRRAAPAGVERRQAGRGRHRADRHHGQEAPRIRQSIAKNMKYGLDTAAQLTTVMEVDVTRVAQLRAKAKTAFQAREGVSLSFLPFFVKAAIEALKAYPVVNSTLSEDLKEITYHGKVNLGIAVDTPRGLIVPVIKDADDLNIAGIARKIVDLAKRTRDNKVGPDELSGGTFTVTNTGSVGALFDTPIFVPPQSAHPRHRRHREAADGDQGR